jgi:predicted metallopeptidase
MLLSESEVVDMNNAVCKKCGKECELPCVALRLLLKIYAEQRNNEKTELIKKLRPLLEILDYETADDLRELGEKIINRFPELSFIKEFGIKIGYIRAYESKTSKGRATFADCRKVSGSYQAYLPFDFLITFYDPNVAILTENQRKIVMYHELRHIEMTPKGLTVRPHDIEDFESILKEHGLNWNQFGNEVPDILSGGGDDGEGQERKGQKGKKVKKPNGAKRHKLETK